MADQEQVALLKRSVTEWNAWRSTHPTIIIDLSRADFREADLSRANLRQALLSGADLTDADLTDADLTDADLMDVKWGTSPSKSNTSESLSINWLSLVETIGTTLLVTTASIASIIQGLDVVERRWREHKNKQQSSSSTQASTQSSSTPSQSNKDITHIMLVMDDGSHHEFKEWVSDPDKLRVYIDAFSDSTSKVKPLTVVFTKREGRALTVDITKDGKDNRQLNVILSYLDANPQL